MSLTILYLARDGWRDGFGGSVHRLLHDGEFCSYRREVGEREDGGAGSRGGGGCHGIATGHVVGGDQCRCVPYGSVVAVTVDCPPRVRMGLGSRSLPLNCRTARAQTAVQH